MKRKRKKRWGLGAKSSLQCIKSATIKCFSLIHPYSYWRKKYLRQTWGIFLCLISLNFGFSEFWMRGEEGKRKTESRSEVRVCSIMCAATLNEMVVSCLVCQLMSFLLKMRGSERTTTSPRLSLWYSPPCLRAKSAPHFSLHKQGVKQVSGKRTTPF